MIRLSIKFDGQHIGADFEPWVSLPDALREMATNVEAIAKGDFDELQEKDYD